ncbi:mechanosensitive ion channel family protein [Alteromonadaceae bacterium BrNp21-10]|nr:mechanosensitive ion channel family protein [Alteromonadaceae bacterium BrNp21-10]
MPQINEFMLTIIDLMQLHKLLSSCVIVFFLLFFKRLLIRLLRKRSRREGADRRHQINSLKQLLNASMVIVLLLLWAPEVQNFAISIAAFTVAIVLAAKEFIQCFLGFIYYLSARSFRIGDWIQINNITGEVLELDWAKVVLLEIDEESFDYTGKHVYVPCSQLVVHTVKNLNFLRRYNMHSFALTVEPTVNVYAYVPQLLDKAIEHCSHFRDVAERYKGLIERHLDVEFINIDPSVTVDTNQFAKMEVHVSLFCPTKEAFNLQQQISADFMSLIHKGNEISKSSLTDNYIAQE